MDNILDNISAENKAKEIVEAVAKEIVTSEAVQNIVKEITTEAVNTVVTQPQPEQSHNQYYKEGVPFLVQLKFDNWNKDTEDKLMSLFMHDEELLPGLKIHRLYKASMHSDSLYLDKICDKLDDIKKNVEDYRSELECLMKKLVR